MRRGAHDATGDAVASTWSSSWARLRRLNAGQALAHEDIARVEHVEGSSDRSFGFVFAAVCLVVALWPLWRGGALRGWSLVLAAAFAVTAALAPRALALPNRLWTKLGLLMGRIVSPIALAILFYAVFMPIGLVMRLVGKDSLKLKRDAAAATYWVRREPPGPPPTSMTNQF